MSAAAVNSLRVVRDSSTKCGWRRSRFWNRLGTRLMGTYQLSKTKVRSSLMGHQYLLNRPWETRGGIELSLLTSGPSWLVHRSEVRRPQRSRQLDTTLLAAAQPGTRRKAWGLWTQFKGNWPLNKPHLLPGTSDRSPLGRWFLLGRLCLAPLHLTGVRRLKPHYLTRLDVSMCGVAVCQHLN